MGNRSRLRIVQGLVRFSSPLTLFPLFIYLLVHSSNSNSLPESKLLLPILDQLASLYPSSKFVKIVSDHCIENYPDKNVPTMLIYRKGQMMGQVVGLGSMGGMKATLRGNFPISLSLFPSPFPSYSRLIRIVRRRTYLVCVQRNRFS